ncbi:uncharacterized protein [Channa argus]|uniref:uncharacterized protein n=1 Tax=Channa argus TaxID=215402 RepID=UPI00351FC82C
MSEESICLYDLLNLAIGKPQRGVVNFNALHALLLAVLRQLDIREIKTEWKESPGDRHLAYLVDVTEAKQPEHTDEKQKADVEPKAEPVTELQESRPSSSSQTPSADIAGEEQWRVISRVQACEDGVSKAMKLIQELQTSTPKDSLTDEIKDHQQKLVGEQEKMVTSMKKCFHRVDALEETVKSLKDTLQKYPEPHTELHEPRPSPSSQTPSTATAKDEQGRFFSRVQACEDGLSKAMKLIQELLTLTHKDSLKDEIKDHQQKFVGEQEEMVTSVEKCFHRVDALEEIVKSLKDTFQKYPEPDTELHEPRPSPSSQTPSTATASDEQWRFFSRVQACEDGLSKAMNLIQELLTLTHKDSLKDEIKDHQQKLVGEQEDMVSSVEKCLHRVDALEETVKSLKDTFQKYPEPDNELHEPRPSPSSQTPSTATASDEQWRLFSRVQACEDGLSKAMKLIQELLTLTHKDSLKDEIKDHQQKLVGEQEKMVTSMKKCFHRVDALEETVKSLKDTFQKYPGPEELSQYVTWDIMQSVLVSKTESLQKVTSTESSTLQEAMDTKPGTEPSSAMSPQQTPLKSDVTGAAMPPSRESGSSVETLRNIGKIKESVNKLDARLAAVEEGKVDQPQLTHLRELITKTVSQDVSNKLMGQLNQQRALIDNLKSDSEKNAELVNNVQEAILQLQAECEKLHETTRCLHEDNRQKQTHIEELYKTMEELEEKKADKQMVESEIKADKSALETKVSRLQFDSATEQLNTMFHELLNKVIGQEQDWHKVIDKLSTEMECKLNRIELDSLKKQLEDRWKNIHKNLQAQGAPEHEDAAGLRKKLMERFNCLSCDRPVMKHTPGPHLVTLPSSPGFPSHKSIRPFTVYALEQFRQHYRSERIAELTDYSHLVVSRSCGGSHTIASPSQRRTGLQFIKHHSQPEVDGIVQSEEVDILGLDGHIYKGRLNPPPIRSTETKLPTISTKDGLCKTKDKSRSSPSHKPPASPEMGHNALVHQSHSAKSAQLSRSVSSISGQDWPVSALGCASQGSISSVAAESNSEPLDK